MTMQSAGQQSMAHHPDIVELRERYDRIAETPQAWIAEGLTFLAGTYAAISAWVIGFFRTSPSLGVTNVVVGLSVMILAVGFAAAYERTHGMTWVAPLLGVWLIVAPWVVQGTDRTTSTLLSNIIVGACIVLIGLGAMVMGRSGSRS